MAVSAKNKKDLLEAVSASGAKVANAGSKSVTVESAGDQKSTRSLLELLKPFGILEVVRTGRIAMGIEEKMVKAGGKPEVNE